MAYVAPADAIAAPHLTSLTARDLSHIPGEDGWPILGNTLRLLADPKREVERMAKAHGLVYRSRAFGLHMVTLLGPEANELVLFDRHKTFSSAEGWNPFLGQLFPRGLMLLDFDVHRLHRKALSSAFKTEPMQAYLTSLNAGIARGVAQWRGPMRFYPAIKQLTLDLAATSFFGRELGPDFEALRRAFVDMVAASVAVVRKPLPGTLMARGVKGRAFMVEFLRREIEKRRDSAGQDLFTELCRAAMDDGRLLSPQEIVDHMSFLMMAAHDTLTSSLTSFIWFLGKHPEWQTRLRDEIAGLKLSPGEPLPYARLDDLPLTEMAFKEALRLIPPVPSLPRRAVRDTEFAGFKIPAGARVGVNQVFTHHMPEIWPEPDRFDPYRFTEANSRHRHKYAFAPFGGGAHMCLGLHFAYMQAKCFAYHFLGQAQVCVPAGYAPPWKLWPIPQPRDGLPVEVKGLR